MVGLFILPGFQLEPAFDKERVSFLNVLPNDFGNSRPKRNLNERSFSFLLSLVVGPVSVNGERNFADRSSFWSVSDLWVAREVAHKVNGIQIWHRNSES